MVSRVNLLSKIDDESKSLSFEINGAGGPDEFPKQYNLVKEESERARAIELEQQKVYVSIKGEYPNQSYNYITINNVLIEAVKIKNSKKIQKVYSS